MCVVRCGGFWSNVAPKCICLHAHVFSPESTTQDSYWKSEFLHNLISDYSQKDLQSIISLNISEGSFRKQDHPYCLQRVICPKDRQECK